jgi:hypothetical protein
VIGDHRAEEDEKIGDGKGEEALFGLHPVVRARAALMASITASVPLLQKRIFSTRLTRPTINSASWISSSVGIEKQVPLCMASVTALRISGCACP